MKYISAGIGSKKITWNPIKNDSVEFVPLEVLDISGASGYTLQSTDLVNRFLRVSVQFGHIGIITFPNNSNTPCRIGTLLYISLFGSGEIQFAGESGVTIHSPKSLGINRGYGRIIAIKTDSNEWEIDGQLK